MTPTLLLMSAIFYLPEFIWHNWECGTMDKLLKDMDLPYINEECWNMQKERLLRFLQGPKRYLKQYAFKYYCCEFLGFLALVSLMNCNVQDLTLILLQVFNMHLMNSVFNNFWFEFYPAIEAFVRNDMKSFAKNSAILFPSQAKCDYFNFGSSGTIQKIDR